VIKTERCEAGAGLRQWNQIEGKRSVIERGQKDFSKDRPGDRHSEGEVSWKVEENRLRTSQKG